MLISGLDGHICDQCAEQAQKIVEKEMGFGGEAQAIDSTSGEVGGKKLPKPTEIKALSPVGSRILIYGGIALNGAVKWWEGGAVHNTALLFKDPTPFPRFVLHSK